MRIVLSRRVFMSATTIAVAIVGLLLAWSQMAVAAPNLEINYQGKLTDSSSVAVTDGEYNMRFFLYNTTGGATTTNIWTEEWLVSASNGVQVTNGLFSTMLGSTTAFTGVDFNQTLYLGVEIGGTGSSPTWDGEMTPRKVLGTVPAAFEAQQLDGLATTSFLRSDQADTLQATESGTLLTLIQDGTGAIFDAINASAESVFKIFESGIVTIGTSTADSIATTTGLAVVNKDVEVRVATGTAIVARGSLTLTGGGDFEGAGPFDIKGNFAYVSSYFADTIAVVDISDPDNPTFISALDEEDDAAGLELDGVRDVVVRGNYAYAIAQLDNGFQVIDISDPTNLRGVANLDGADPTVLLNGASDLAIQGNYAYIAARDDNAIQIIDISDPTNPFGVGSITDGTNGADILAAPRGVEVRGNYAYIGSNDDNGMQILDISDPSNPIGLGSIVDSGGDQLQGSREVRLSGNYAYVAGYGDNGITVIDISDPSNPTSVGAVGSGLLTNPEGLTLAGNYLFVAASLSDSIVMVDVSDPASPSVVAQIQDDEQSGAGQHLRDLRDVRVQGNYLYTSAFTDDTLGVWDIPSLITPTANIGNLVSNDIESDYLRVTEQLTADGSLNVGTNALIGGALTITGTASSSLQSTNTNPALTVTSGYVGIGTTTPYQDLSIDGDVALTGALFDNNASSGESGYVLQSTGSGLAWVATSTLGFAADGGGSSLFTDDGDITYLTSLTDVLAIGTSTDVATSTGLAVYNRDVEVLIGTGTPLVGVGSIDRLDAGTPRLNGPRGMDKQGDLLYVVENASGALQILDVSDPTNPTPVGNVVDGATNLDNLGGARHVVVRGNYAYVTAQTDDAFMVIDVSDPTNPTGIFSISSSTEVRLNGASEIAIDGNYAYIASFNDGAVQVFDISDPTNPIPLGYIQDGNNGATELAGAVGITIRGNYAYVNGNTDNGVQILDISDPTNLIGVGAVTTVTSPGGAGALKGNYLFVPSLGDAVDVIDVSDPASPVEVASISDSDAGTLLDSPRNIRIAGNYAFITAFTSDAVQVLDISSSTNPVPAGWIRDGENGADELNGARTLLISGNYMYVAGFEDDGIQVIDMGGLITPTANIGNLFAGTIETDYLRVTQSLIADSSLNVGTNALIGGTLTVVGSASSSLQGDITQAALAVTSGGIGIGTTTLATSTGLAVYNKDVEISLGNPTLLGGADVGTNAYKVEVVGDLAYVGSLNAGDDLQVFDVSDPANPTLLGGVDAGDTVTGLAVRGNYAYVSSGTTGDDFEIFDISNPTNPIKVGGYEIGFGTGDMTVRGKYAYVATYNGDFQIFDISDPTNPIFIGSAAAATSFALSIEVAGNYAYVGTLNTGDDLEIFDIKDPANPVKVSGVELGGGVRSIVIDGTRAYIGTDTGADGLGVYDISDPYNPINVGSSTKSASVYSVNVLGNFAIIGLLTTTGDNIEVYDISDPTNLQQVGSADAASNLTHTFVAGTRLYATSLSSGDDLQIYDLAGLVTPTAIIGNLASNDITTDYLRVIQSLIADSSLNVEQNAVIGGTLSIVGSASSTLQGEGINATLSVTSGALGVGVSSGIATGTGLAVQNKDIEISFGASALRGIGSIADGENGATVLASSTNLEIVDNYVYVVSPQDGGLQIIDISDPANPTGIGSITDGNNGADELTNAINLDVVGNYAYVVSSGAEDGFQILDISNPTNIRGVGSVTDGANGATVLNGAFDVAVSGNYAYVTSGADDGVQVIDISDPTNPTGVGSITDGNNGADRLNGALDIEIVGNYAYVVSYDDDGFQVLDISDPTNPIGVGSITDDTNGATTLFGPSAVAVSGNYAYVTSFDENGVQILDISDPTNPTGIGSITDGNNGATTLFSAQGVTISGNYLYVTSLDDAGGPGVQVIDISSSTNPIGVSVITDGNDGADRLRGAYDVEIAGNYAYVASQDDDGIQIIDLVGFTAPTAEIGNLLANEIQTNYLRVTQSLVADSGLNVATDALIGGALTVGGNASSSVEESTDATLAITSGALGIGTSTDIATTTGVAVYNKDIESLIGTGTALIARGTITDSTGGTELNGAYGLDVVGNLAYITGTIDDGVEIIDVSDPDNPVSIGSIQDGVNNADFLNNAYDIVVKGNYAYVASNDDNAVQVLDISNPANIRGVGAIASSTVDNSAPLVDANGLTISGNYLYVTAGGSNALTIIDISDPTNPIASGKIVDGENGADRLGTAWGVAIQGNYAYVAADTDNAIQVIDISDSTNPVGVGSINDGSNGADRLQGAKYPVISGNLLYVASANTDDGLQIIDISDPANPTGLGEVAKDENGADFLNGANSVAVSGNYAFVAGRDDNAVQVIDISDSDNPVGAGAILDNEVVSSSAADTLDSTRRIKVQGKFVYVTSLDDDGLQILEIGGFVAPTAEIGALASNDIESDYVRVTQSLISDGSLNVGQNAMINGALTITGVASSSLQSGNSNAALSITSGTFGIGTSTPYADLSVTGDLAITGGIYDINGSLGTTGMVLQTSGTSFEWVATSSLGITGVAGALFTDGGDVTYLNSLTDVLAIGTTTDIATSTGFAVYDRDIEVLIGSGTPMYGLDSVRDGNDGTDIMNGAVGLTVVGDYAYVAANDDGGLQIIDISDPNNLVGVGSVADGTSGADTLSQVRHVEVQGNYAYLPSRGDNGVQIIDISNPANPIGVGSITDGANGADELNTASGLTVRGNYAYVASEDDDGVQILDISDPTNPIGVGSITDGANGADELNGAVNIVVQGNYAYVASIVDDGVQILDISDPTNPIGVGSITDGANGADELNGAQSILVSGNYAYVTGINDDGVQILDISDPTNPIGVGSITDGANGADYLFSVRHLALAGNYLFVTAEVDSAIQVIDISSSTNPVGAGFILDGTFGADEIGFPQYVAVQGNYLYVTDFFGDSLQVIEIAGLTTPTANIGNLLADDIQTDYLTVTQALVGDTSLNVGVNALVGGTLTIGGNASSSLIGVTTEPALTITSGALAVGTSTGIATSTGLAVVNKDIQLTAGTPTLVGALTLNGASVSGMDIVGDLAYLVFNDAALNEFQIVSITDPTNPASVASLELGDDVGNIQVVGNYAYVTGDDYFGIVDISNPYNPIVLDTVTSISSLAGLAIDGGYAYLTNNHFSSEGDLYIYDISDPTNLREVTNVDLGDRARSVEVIGNYAYIGVACCSVDELKIYDISDPTNPVFVGEGNANESINDMEIDGTRLYAVTSFGSPRVEEFDISDPASITSAIPLSFDVTATNIDLAGDYLYIGTQGDTDDPEVWVWDTTVPYTNFNAETVASIDVSTGGEDIEGVQVHNGYLYVASELASGNFQVYDLGSFITPTAEIGVLTANTIESDYLRVSQSLSSDGSLNVAANAMIGGSLAITGVASSALQSTFTSPALTVTSGYVGIGTSTPFTDLSIEGDLAITGGIYDTNASRGTTGDLLQTTGSAVSWTGASGLGISAGGSLFTDAGDTTYLTSLTDVLAIGTTTDIATSTALSVYNRDIEVLAANPTLVATVNDGDASGATELASAYDVVLQGNYAYVSGEGDDGVSVLDISDPANPVAVANILRASADITHMNDPKGMDIQGDYLYVAGNSSSAEEGLQIIDISNPANPVGVGGIGDGEAGATTLAEANDVKVLGNYAYVVGVSDDGLQIIDISDPTNPVGVGAITDGTNGADELNGPELLQVRGNYAYVASPFDNGFQIIDISDPTNPIGLGELTDTGSINLQTAGDFVLKGNYAYLTSFSEDAVNVIDISDPNNPTVVNSIVDGTNGANQLEGVEGITLAGNYLYTVSAVDGAVQVLDISSSTNPVGVGALTGLADGTQIAVHGGYLYATANGQNDLNIARIPTLTTPTASIGNLLSDDIETSYLTVTQALRADSLNVNTNAMVGGALTITGTASSSLISSNSNTALTITSGFVQIGTSTNATSGIQIGYGAICVDNDGACTASTTGRISSVSTYSGNSDLAETYFSADDLSAGDIVTLEENLSVSMANRDEDKTIIGVVSTKPGVLLGFDDVSLEDGEVSYPIALKGRVPVKVTTENGPINPGDQLMLSSIPGMAMKATGTGAVVGIALEAFDPDESDQYFSDTFINQFTDDLPSTEDVEAVIEELTASTTETIALDNDDVQQGQIVMFVELGYRYLDDATSADLATLVDDSSEDEEGSIFSRIMDLARGFVGGALSIFAVEADRVEVVDELCINGTCIQSDDLRVLIDSLEDGVTQVTVIEDEGPAGDDISVDISDENDDIVTAPVASSTTPQNPATTTNSGENTASTTDEIGDTNITASTTTTGGDLVNSTTTSPTENTEIEPQNTDEDVQLENVEETTVADEEPQAEETPVSSDVGEAETPEEETPPEPEPVEEVDTPVVEEPVATEEVNQETS